MGDVATAKPMTASQQLRKVRKPLIERKRRERINGCLNELKSLVLDALNKDEAQFSKLEKADILELALEVLRKKQKQQTSPPAAPEPSVIASKYTAGFSQCALEVARCLGTIQGVKPEIRVHLTEHLAGCVQKLAKVANTVGATLPVEHKINSPVLDIGYSQNNCFLVERQQQITTATIPNDTSAVSIGSQSMPAQYSPTDTPTSSPVSTIEYTVPMTSSIPVYTTQHVQLVSCPPALAVSPQVGIVHPLQPNTHSGQISPSYEKDTRGQTGFYAFGSGPVQKVNPVGLMPIGGQMESRENVWRPWS